MTFAASLALHAALWAFVLRAQPRPPADDAPREDPWAGNGLEVDAIREAPPSVVTGAGHVLSPASPPVPETTREPSQAAEATVRRPDHEEREPRPKPLASAALRAAPSAPTTATTQASTSAATPADSGGAATNTGVFGAVGLPPGVRHLALAFARALPKGAHADAAFRELPLGKLGEAHVRLRVDDDGKLGPLEFRDERTRDTLPAPIVRMLDNALRLLAFGRFSLSNTKLEPGVLSLRVRVELSEEAPSVAENAQPNHVRELKGPASGAENPKRAWFVLNSGRRVDAWVHEE